MEELLLDILETLRSTGSMDDKMLAALIRHHNKDIHDNSAHFAKKQLSPYYQRVKTEEPARWESWNIDSALEKKLLAAIRVKPRRTASGVATITVLTKPWQCSGNCLYCPNDVRMPKSYLSEEPACQRAERSFFDPYLQATARLRTLSQMGHVIDKAELIILGGTWGDYPESYRLWFVSELFRALNENPAAIERHRAERIAHYERLGMSCRKEELIAATAEIQRSVDDGGLTYNQAVRRLYGENPTWQAASSDQTADWKLIDSLQCANETARHRMVGLVVETRPDNVTASSLRQLRRLGCTKIQMGVQSLDPRVLDANRRNIGIDTMRNAFELVRAFGFKIHAHFMVNLYGSSAAEDERDYQRFMAESPYQPDEVKLYPCVLVAGTDLRAHYANGSWTPYSEEQLVDILVHDTLATPAFTRISRMIRDISSQDIIAGNKKINLRQMVEHAIAERGDGVSEIRYREIGTQETTLENLALDEVRYGTSVSSEVFLQWVTPEDKIAGFLRLSLPNADYVRAHAAELPIGENEAMIREVHVYGRVAGLHKTGAGAQHLGLGRQLIKRACALARAAGYTQINVVSSVGTREYYRKQGFSDGELYQHKAL